MYWIALQPEPQPTGLQTDALVDPHTALGWWALRPSGLGQTGAPALWAPLRVAACAALA